MGITIDDKEYDLEREVVERLAASDLPIADFADALLDSATDESETESDPYGTSTATA